MLISNEKLTEQPSGFNPSPLAVRSKKECTILQDQPIGHKGKFSRNFKIDCEIRSVFESDVMPNPIS